MKTDLLDVFEKKTIRRTYLVMFIALIVMLGAVYYDLETNATNAAIQEGISDSLIRFHVIANSDTKEDQELKLKVRDAIIEGMQETLEQAANIEETRLILSEGTDAIKGIAEAVVTENGKNYPIKVHLGMDDFPLKTYGDIVLPPGKYEALIVEIGEAKGKNWWCVMFPPLCFVDITHGVVPDNSKEGLKNVLTEDEFNAILMSDVEENIPVKIKFKLFDWFSQDKQEDSTKFVKIVN